MAIEDHFDLYPYDDDEDDGVVCRHCGEGALQWQRDGLRPRLYDDNGVLHVCKPSADDFEDLT